MDMIGKTMRDVQIGKGGCSDAM